MFVADAATSAMRAASCDAGNLNGARLPNFPIIGAAHGRRDLPFVRTRSNSSSREYGSVSMTSRWKTVLAAAAFLGFSANIAAAGSANMVDDFDEVEFPRVASSSCCVPSYYVPCCYSGWRAHSYAWRYYEWRQRYHEWARAYYWARRYDFRYRQWHYGRRPVIRHVKPRLRYYEKPSYEQRERQRMQRRDMERGLEPPARPPVQVQPPRQEPPAPVQPRVQPQPAPAEPPAQRVEPPATVQPPAQVQPAPAQPAPPAARKKQPQPRFEDLKNQQ
jgi:hypothetical protein